MTDTDFDIANERRTGAGGPAFANPRSAAAGSLHEVRAYDVSLSFFAYGAPDLHPGAADTIRETRWAELGGRTRAEG